MLGRCEDFVFGVLLKPERGRVTWPGRPALAVIPEPNHGLGCRDRQLPMINSKQARDGIIPILHRVIGNADLVHNP